MNAWEHISKKFADYICIPPPHRIYIYVQTLKTVLNCNPGEALIDYTSNIYNRNSGQALVYPNIYNY
jgi:hypothetical protein